MDLFELQRMSLALAEDRRLGAIQAHYIDPWYEDDQEKQEEDGDGDGDYDDQECDSEENQPVADL